MNLLLDTHVLLWWLDDPQLITNQARKLIADGGNQIFVSAVVAWEITIKRSLGKLAAPDDLESVILKARFTPLPIAFSHVLAVGHLPDHHRDPFDRLLIAQARIENLAIMTRDPQVIKYEVATIRA